MQGVEVPNMQIEDPLHSKETVVNEIPPQQSSGRGDYQDHIELKQKTLLNAGNTLLLTTQAE